MTDVVVIGSLNLDLTVSVPRLPRPGETVAGPNAERDPGGKGANQAVAAARLGGTVRLAGLVGDDDCGSDLRAAVAAHGRGCLPRRGAQGPLDRNRSSPSRTAARTRSPSPPAPTAP
ncbi:MULTISPECIES: PfkB family carbohydrate kinase [unclassified Streptomyces]|uniref:PfkB family carbohydrate kinase n=1 Tax=unclassified Streptomyces TaxID=2593676 RepID=UPI0034413CA8